uniref:Uncharacterized protein n=1 Tax=Eutreptiella gymnastica TaxID=73025 RepID=A0A7S4FDX0_9EUGL
MLTKASLGPILDKRVHMDQPSENQGFGSSEGFGSPQATSIPHIDCQDHCPASQKTVPRGQCTLLATYDHNIKVSSTWHFGSLSHGHHHPDAVSGAGSVTATGTRPLGGLHDACNEKQ